MVDWVYVIIFMATFTCINYKQFIRCSSGVVVINCCLAEQEVRGSIRGLTTTITGIGYLLLISRDMAEILLKQR